MIQNIPWGRVDWDLGNVEKTYVVPIGDIHLGDPRCNLEKLFGYLDWIKYNNAYMLLNGDLMTADIKDSVGDVYSSQLNPQEQLDKLIEMFLPYRDKILAMTEGNHEQRIYKATGLNPTKILADALGVKAYNPDAMDILIRLGKGKNGKPILYRLFMTHGWANGRKIGGKISAVEEISRFFPIADCYIASHTHTQAVATDIIVFPDDRNKGYIELKRLFVSSGSFLDYGGYVLRKGYPIAKLGSPRLRLDGTRKDIHCSI